MFSGLGQPEGLFERLLETGGASDAAWLAGVAVVVGIMLWAAGARAVSLAFAAAGGTAGLFAGFMLAEQVQIPPVAGLPGSLIAAAAGAGIGVIIALVAMRLVVAGATGLTTAAAAAGIAILVTPHLPPSIIGEGADAAAPASTAPPSASQPDSSTAPTEATWTDGTWTDQWPPLETNASMDQPAPEATRAIESPQDAAGSLATDVILDHAGRAWTRVPERMRGEAALAVLACGLLGALLGAVWPARIASATTAFMGAAIWPIGAIQMQGLAGSPIAIEAVPVQTWLIAWIVLGMVGLGIQRLVLRKVTEN